MAEEFSSYKGYPILRKGKEIYYGNMSDKYVCMLNIISVKTEGALEVSKKIRVFLMLTDENIDASKMIEKTSDRNNLFEALDVAYIWLKKSNAA